MSRTADAPPVLRLLALSALLVPVAAAQETLGDLEEPHAGLDKIWTVRVTPDEANASRALIYRNAPRSPFGLVVYDASGHEVFAKNGTRGVQTLPALPAGDHRFFVRGTGEFQATEKTLGRDPQRMSVNATLERTDAYVLTPQKSVNVSIEGAVRVEWYDLTGGPADVTPPFTRLADPGGVYILTVRGDQGTAYSIALADAATPEPMDHADTPSAPIALVLLLVGLLAGLGKRVKPEGEVSRR